LSAFSTFFGVKKSRFLRDFGCVFL
jgi:hypothetical protein